MYQTILKVLKKFFTQTFLLFSWFNDRVEVSLRCGLRSRDP